MTIITWILICLTLGFIRLLFHWWPHWVLYTMFKRCPLNEADRVLIVVSFCFILLIKINKYVYVLCINYITFCIG